MRLSENGRFVLVRSLGDAAEIEASRKLTDNVNAIGISPGTSTFAVGLRDGSLEILAPEGRALATLASFELDGAVSAVEFDPSGQLLAATTFNGYLYIVSMADLRINWQHESDNGWQIIRWSRYGDRVAVLSLLGRVEVRERQSGQIALAVNADELNGTALDI